MYNYSHKQRIYPPTGKKDLGEQAARKKTPKNH